MPYLVVFEYEGVLVVDSRLVAEALGVEHESLMKNAQKYQSRIEQRFGVFRFQIGKPSSPKGGRPERFIYLNEGQATYLMTLSSNTDQVVDCKGDLVEAFINAKEVLRRQQEVSYANHVPYWYQRMRLALSDISKPLPDGHFCIYLRMMDIFSQLEIKLNYIVPDISPCTNRRLIPDISIGRRFNDFLRATDEVSCEARRYFLGSDLPVDFREGGSDYNRIKFYNHVYPESSHGKNNIQPSKAYPIEYSSIFDYFLQEVWIPDNCVKYLKERDPEGVVYLRNKFNQLPDNYRASLSQTLLGKLLFSLPSAK